MLSCKAFFKFNSFLLPGGTPSTDGKWPWMAQVTTNNLNHECGASVVSLDWIITAAHCFVDRSAWKMLVGYNHLLNQTN